MPRFIHHQGGHVHRMLDEIRAAVYTVVGTLDIEAWRTPEPVPFRRRRSGERMKLAAATLRIDLPVRSVAETDLMEEGHRRLAFRNRRVSLVFRPFEIKTLALKRAGK